MFEKNFNIFVEANGTDITGGIYQIKYLSSLKDTIKVSLIFDTKNHFLNGPTINQKFNIEMNKKDSQGKDIKEFSINSIPFEIANISSIVNDKGIVQAKIDLEFNMTLLESRGQRFFNKQTCSSCLQTLLKELKWKDLDINTSGIYSLEWIQANLKNKEFINYIVDSSLDKDNQRYEWSVKRDGTFIYKDIANKNVESNIVNVYITDKISSMPKNSYLGRLYYKNYDIKNNLFDGYINNEVNSFNIEDGNFISNKSNFIENSEYANMKILKPQFVLLNSPEYSSKLKGNLNQEQKSKDILNQVQIVIPTYITEIDVFDTIKIIDENHNFYGIVYSSELQIDLINKIYTQILNVNLLPSN